MIEENLTQQEVIRYNKRENPVLYYFNKVRELELEEDYLQDMCLEVKNIYVEILNEAYDILFDRIITSKVSHYIKKEIEEWYSFNRDFLGFCDIVEINRDLEGLLRRFELI